MKCRQFMLPCPTEDADNWCGIIATFILRFSVPQFSEVPQALHLLSTGPVHIAVPGKMLQCPV